MVWTFSVHTAIDIKKGSVINVVCYERVCYEHGLLWKWSVLNGLLWVACYERVCLEWEPFWIIVMFLWVTSFKLFTVIGFSAKAPSYWRWWWQLHMLQQFWPQKKCKLYGMILKFSGWLESLINNAPPDRDGRKGEACF